MTNVPAEQVLDKTTADETPPSGDPKTSTHELYKPKDAPDHLVGKSDHETIDLIFKAYTGARETLAKSGKHLVPEKIDDYKIDIPDEVGAKILRKDANGKDPLLESMTSVFYAEGIQADKAVNIITKFYEKIQETLDVQNEAVPKADFDFQALGGADKAKPVVDGVLSRLSGMKQTGKLSDADVAELTFLTAYSEGLSALQKVLVLAGEKPIPANLGHSSGSGSADITKESLDKRVADPRYRRGHPTFDQAFYDETAKMFQEFYASDLSY